LGKVVSIIGYLVTRKRTRTTRGDEMSFGTFLDREGRFIDTTHFPPVLKKYPFQGRACYLIKGKVVEEFGFYSLEVTEMQRLYFVTRLDEENPVKERPTPAPSNAG
jgi:error-prone DNA polymerase